MTDREHPDELPTSAIANDLREASRLVAHIVGANNLLAQAADHIERLHKDLIIALELNTTAIRERDSARRWVCRFDAESRSKHARRCGMSDYDHTPLQMAQERGWDCFRGIE